MLQPAELHILVPMMYSWYDWAYGDRFRLNPTNFSSFMIRRGFRLGLLYVQASYSRFSILYRLLTSVRGCSGVPPADTWIIHGNSQKSVEMNAVYTYFDFGIILLSDSACVRTSARGMFSLVIQSERDPRFTSVRTFQNSDSVLSRELRSWLSCRKNFYVEKIVLGLRIELGPVR